MSKVLTILNRQCEGCGVPPNLEPDINKYIGYFQNEYGEQSVVIFDFETKSGLFYSGDYQWTKPFQIDSEGIVSNLVMSPLEEEWYASCQKGILKALWQG